MTQPQPVRIESRVSATERRQLNIEARLEELSEDMLASFLKNAEHQIKLEQKIDALSEEMDTRFDAVKADMATMEDRILSAFQQLVAVIETRLPARPKE